MVETPTPGDKRALTLGPVCARKALQPIERISAPELERGVQAIGQQGAEDLSDRNQSNVPASRSAGRPSRLAPPGSGSRRELPGRASSSAGSLETRDEPATGSTRPTRVRARPVIPRGQPAAKLPPHPHRRSHYPLASPAPLDRAGVAGLAGCVGVALPVAPLCVRAAATVHPHVAGLDRLRLLARWVREACLDRRRRAAEPVRDLPDREVLGLAVIARQATARRRSAMTDRLPRITRITRRWHTGHATSLDWRFRPALRTTGPRTRAQGREGRRAGHLVAMPGAVSRVRRSFPRRA